MTFLPESFLALNLTISSPIVQLLNNSSQVADCQFERSLGNSEVGQKSVRKEGDDERQ